MRQSYLFTARQYGRLANICDNAGQVFLATVVLPHLFGTPVSSVSPFVLSLVGVLPTVLLWWFALRLERVISV
jgi:hypothetical protein